MTGQGQQPGETLQEYVARSRREQGLPEKVEDPAVLAKVARIILAARERDQQRGAA